MLEMTIVPLILLAIAVTSAVIFEFVLPSATPGGFVVASGVGYMGAWLGSAGLWHFGPDLAGIPLLPAVICSVIMLFLFAMVCGGHSHAWD